MKLNLTACSINFTSGNSSNYTYKYPEYAYYGPVRGILNGVHPHPPLITLEGCKKFCGEEVKYYPWPEVSSTITTWVLPVIGLLLQAPFESNENFKSFLALSRWIGNPIASISYVLWNIKVSGKCAMMVDMATQYDEFPGADSQFDLINQDLVKQEGTMIAAEKLLRIALFSDELPMTTEISLTDRRKKLAGTIRAFRKKGVIPVFVSTLWFLLALAISTQDAFGNPNTNRSAHDLALGLLLAFLPIFILSCIVDRNAIGSAKIAGKLNHLLASVHIVLLNDSHRIIYGERIQRPPEYFDWVRMLHNDSFDNFFTDFAGQARIRWHYGVAHSLLCSFEDRFIAETGRGWLLEDSANQARTLMRDHEEQDHRLIWFDPRMIWQIASSFCVVGASAGGAFILSYFTPTVGLGCRSGGYMIYVVIATCVFLIEMMFWGIRESYLEHRHWVWWLVDYTPPYDPIEYILRRIERSFSRTNPGKFSKAGRTQVKRIRNWWRNSTKTGLVDMFLRIMEIGNSGWLVYIVLAQTIGSYQTCDCISSTWASGGGYSDFEAITNDKQYRKYGILKYWGAGTALSCSILAVGLAYIVAEYCTQSHLATENYEDACEGMKLTRRVKKYTYWLRSLLDLSDYIILLIWRMVNYPWRKATNRQKNLVWDWKAKARGAEQNFAQASRDQSRRRPSIQPLMEDSDGGFSPGDRHPEHLDSEGPEYQAHDNEQYGSRNADPSHISMPTLQLPTATHPNYTHSYPPSPSSDTSSTHLVPQG